MNELSLDIASTILELTKKKFNNDFTEIKEVKLFWHNLTLLVISQANCQILSKKHKCTLFDFEDLQIIPTSLLQFQSENTPLISIQVGRLVDRIINENRALSLLRECLMRMELHITKKSISIKQGKNTRDTTGSYYTPKKLATSVVEKLFSKPQVKTMIRTQGNAIKIADLSCGGGEFFKTTQEFLIKEYGIPYEVSACYFWGIDIDPIALQITVCDLLYNANPTDWEVIAGHFYLGNPLVPVKGESDFDKKNMLFALNNIYDDAMGIDFNNLGENFNFDIILGNPPWEKIRFEERKFLTSYAPDIAILPKKNDRQAKISKLEKDWNNLFVWITELTANYSLMCGKSYRHPLLIQSIFGELNTYALFTELAYTLLNENGISSLIVKNTLFTTPAHKKLWQYLLERNAIESLYFFNNKKKIFNIDSRERFAVVTLSKEKTDCFTFSTGLQTTDDLQSGDEIYLSEHDIKVINPFTGMIPNVMSNKDIHILIQTHKRLPVFDEIYPSCHFGRLIHLTAHAKQIDTKMLDDNIPIYEGKFIEQYDARFSTFSNMTDDKKYTSKATARKNEVMQGVKEVPVSRFFVKESLWSKYNLQYPETFSLCWRSLTSPTNQRTMLAMILPTCPTCQSIQMLQVGNNTDLLLLLGLFNSLPFDYFVRLKMPGIDLTQSVVRQIPVPCGDMYNQVVFFNERNDTLRTHILSCVCHLLKDENRLELLLSDFDDEIYPIQHDITQLEVRKTLDKLFACAYQMSDSEYLEVLKSFPKY